MSTYPADESPEAVALRAEERAERHAADAVADFFLDGGRLDERTRLVTQDLIGQAVRALDAAIRRHAARLLAQLGDDPSAERLLGIRTDLAKWLSRPGALPADLTAEFIAQARHDILTEALPVEVTGPEETSLAVRLTTAPDPVVAGAAAAMLGAEARRRTGAGESELPAELHHRLAWRVAAALRVVAGGGAALDRALAEAARRSIAAHDEGERLDAAAMRLASAIDARPDERGPLLVSALGDRRLALFVAVLAHALDLDFAEVRALVIAPDDDRLWICLRAAALGRTEIARIAFALSEADPRRDIERLADRLDAIAAIDVMAAAGALAPLALPPEFRLAIQAVERR